MIPAYLAPGTTSTLVAMIPRNADSGSVCPARICSIMASTASTCSACLGVSARAPLSPILPDDDESPSPPPATRFSRPRCFEAPAARR